MKLFNDLRFFLFLATVVSFIVSPRLHANMVIDFQKGDDLKVVFDGGVRPWRVQGLERSHLEFGSADAEIALPTGETFRFPANRGTLQVIEGNKLVSCTLFGKEIPLAEGVALAKAVCNSLSIPTTGLDLLAEEPRTITDPSKNWSARDNNKGEVSIRVALQAIFHPEGSIAIVTVSMGWKRSPSEGGLLPGPVQPPSGYEGVSMEPPKRNPNAKPFPEHGPEYYRDLAAQAKLKGSQPSAPATPVQTATPAPLPPVPPGAENPAPVVERKSALWPWLIGMLVLVVIVAVALKRRA